MATDEDVIGVLQYDVARQKWSKFCDYPAGFVPDFCVESDNEAITDYICVCEKEENQIIENASIKIETSASQKRSHRLNPMHKTMPKKGLYDLMETDDETSSDGGLDNESSSEPPTDKEDMIDGLLRHALNAEQIQSNVQSIRAKTIWELGYVIADDVETKRY
eukprot:1001279_1